jgi:hypothetical protein
MQGKKSNLPALIEAATSKRKITTLEAADLTGYSPDHIGLLLRRKILEGKKIGRDWFVEAESLYEYVKKEIRPGRK